ncbi:MAG: lipoyl(octanoyl) transferase LipB [Myxococcota bacterium]
MQSKFLGYQVSYQAGMDAMREAIEQIDTRGNQLLYLEHADTITHTRQHGLRSLLLTPEAIAQRGITLAEADRGGDVTFHGTGQLVGYPIIKLPLHIGVVDYVRGLERALIRACQELGVTDATCLPGKTGVWVGNKKLIAVGVGVSRQVTRHGFALNINPKLERFTECITPCGLAGFEVTSLEREISAPVSFGRAMEVLSWHLKQIC